MQALDAALAFAITMLILAMVVTTLVETLHRLFGLREKGLAILLGNFYDRVLFSRSGGVLRGTDDRRAFIEMMTINRGPVGKAPITGQDRSLNVDSIAEDRKFLNWIWSGRRLGSLSLMAFMERLGGSDYGAQLVTQASNAGEKGIEWVLKDVAQKFDAFGAEASEYFEARARLLAVIVGFVLAFAINVNAIALFETFMKRPDVTRAVIARVESVTKSYENLQKHVDVLNESAQDAPNDAARASVQRAADEAAAAVDSLQSVGVPIGWNTQSVAEFRRSSAMSLLGLLLGGLLIGLGGPFWYKAVQTLTGVRAFSRRDQGSRGDQGTTDTPSTAATATPPTSAPNQVPNTPIDAFHAALGATLAAGELRPFEEAVG
jgi:hypothetical protein